MLPCLMTVRGLPLYSPLLVQCSPPAWLLFVQSVGDTRELFRSVSGLSPNAALKRERLAQRNYIMRATGFLETEPLAAGTIGGLALKGAEQLSRLSTSRCTELRAVPVPSQ